MDEQKQPRSRYRAVIDFLQEHPESIFPFVGAILSSAASVVIQSALADLVYLSAHIFLLSWWVIKTKEKTRERRSSFERTLLSEFSRTSLYHIVYFVPCESKWVIRRWWLRLRGLTRIKLFVAYRKEFSGISRSDPGPESSSVFYMTPKGLFDLKLRGILETEDYEKARSYARALGVDKFNAFRKDSDAELNVV